MLLDRGGPLSAKLVDLFAGCGGLALGMEQAGYESVFVNELHPAALNSYLINRRSTRLHEARNHANDIRELTGTPERLSEFAGFLRAEHGEIDLVAGGPPCQGFSGIGHRRTFDVAKSEIPSNHLFKDMAALISAVAPKAFLFENVRGILTGRWTQGGDRGEIWEDVRSEFESIRTAAGDGYLVRWALVAAKDYGVPQNRPRVLMVGIRSDLGVEADPDLFADGLLPARDPALRAPDPADFLGDLVDPDWAPGGATPFYLRPPATDAQLYYRTTRDQRILGRGAPLTEHEYSRHSARVMERFLHMQRYGAPPDGGATKKFAQRVIPRHWGPRGPHITATSLPDDYIHFDQPRVPTVREWARMQTFPDWYQFAGPRTTGGRRRAGDPSAGVWHREVPKYTQIGNAVPVRLAHAVGSHLLELLGSG